MAKIGRNERCPCGSGKKYKRCCGRLGSPQAKSFQMDSVARIKLRQFEAERVQRERQQGLGKGIMAPEFAGGRVVCVGNTIFHSKSWKTFHDFLRHYLIERLDREWFNAERAKPDEQRHPIVKWHEQSIADFGAAGVKEDGVISAPMTGAQRAFLNLAYNIYLIEHHADVKTVKELLATFVDRLKSTRSDDFIGKLFETYAAAAFLKAGFKLDYEDESDPNGSHVEFVATYPKTKRKFSVEVKARNRTHDSDDEGLVDDIKRLRVANKLNKALAKSAAHDRVVLIEINVPDVLTGNSLEGWPQAALDQVRHAEKSDYPDGTQKPSAYVIVTNHAFHNNLPALDVGTQAIAAGFHLPDFGPNVEFAGYKAFLDARERHIEMHDLMESMRTHYAIPATFDGSNPELAFLPKNDPALPPLKIGEWYQIPNAEGTDVAGQLIDAIVLEERKLVHGLYKTAAGTLHATVPISDAELAAYRRHPDTFFGVLRQMPRRAETYLDLCEFFYESYKNTPQEKLLEFLKGAPDFEQLKDLSQRDLSITCCERWAQSAVSRSERSAPPNGEDPREARVVDLPRYVNPAS